MTLPSSPLPLSPLSSKQLLRNSTMTSVTSTTHRSVSMGSEAVSVKTSATSTSNKNNDSSGGATATANAAIASLELLLREDPLLSQYGLQKSSNEEASYKYAASLLLHNEGADDGTGTTDDDQDDSWQPSHGIQQRANEALEEVDRKLALVASLAQRVSMERPEDVAGPLLRLHGFDLLVKQDQNEGGGGGGDQASSLPETSTAGEGGGGGLDEDYDGKDPATATATATTTTTTLAATRERCDRLRRQGEVLEGVAKRVESSLNKGLGRMEAATERLSRVLQLSATFKMVMRLLFESKKLESLATELLPVDGNEDGVTRQRWSNNNSNIDLRDLTHAAASVAVIEELLLDPQFKEGGIHVVEAMRPWAKQMATAVRRAAAGLLLSSTNTQYVSATQLGATLQVYFHLSELPQAVWGAVQQSLADAQVALRDFVSLDSMQRLLDNAQAQAKALVEEQQQQHEGAAGTSATDSAESKRGKKKQAEVQMQRMLKKKMREVRTEAATRWAQAVTKASLQVWNLHRVLTLKSDPVTRQVFAQVVADAPIPSPFHEAARHLRRDGVSDASLSIFRIYWQQLCLSCSEDIQSVLVSSSSSSSTNLQVASLYPAMRAAAVEMVAGLYDTMQAGMGTTSTALLSSSSHGSGGNNEDAVGSMVGIMGGSVGLDGGGFWGSSWSSNNANSGGEGAWGNHNLGSFTGGITGADTWTKADAHKDSRMLGGISGGAASAPTSTSSSSLSSVFSSAEWIALDNDDKNRTGLYPLRQAFLENSRQRLTSPLQYMFPETVSVDENGDALSVLPPLPSRYDIQKLETLVKDELGYADPRNGGGDLSMAAMLCEVIEEMMEEFSKRARGAISDTNSARLHADGTATEALRHDLNVVGVMGAFSALVRNSPENTFVVPYKPAHSQPHEEAAHACQVALRPALEKLDNLARSQILIPLCQSLNIRVATGIARIHYGAFLDQKQEGSDHASFVQQHLSGLYESIAANFLSKLPADYANFVACTVATYSIYSFVSNASLVRPLGETGRLRITQDLADFELALEQLVLQGGNSNSSLSLMDHGKPYAELRAARQMLFWTGLEDKSRPAAEVAKAMLREVWVKDVRPSTVFHFLFGFAPTLLSSPHHMKRLKIEEYVSTELVKLDASIDDGEATAWMTTMACCDAYQQRESVHDSTANSSRGGGSAATSAAAAAVDGDRRVAAILMMLGPELLRRRRQ